MDRNGLPGVVVIETEPHDTLAVCPECGTTVSVDDLGAGAECPGCYTVMVWRGNRGWRERFGNPATFEKRIRLAPVSPEAREALAILGRSRWGNELEKSALDGKPGLAALAKWALEKARTRPAAYRLFVNAAMKQQQVVVAGSAAEPGGDYW